MTYGPKLDEIDLSRPLNGSEGLDANYLSRIRTQFLFAQHQAMITQLQFADAKAAALMALIGLAAVRWPISFLNAPSSDDILTLPQWALAFMIASVGFCIASLFPRLPSPDIRDDMAERDLWSWPSLINSRLNAYDFAEFMQTSEVSQLIYSVALSNAAIARILLAKFKMLRFGFFCACIAIALTMLWLLTK